MLQNRNVKKKYFEIPLSRYFLKSKKRFFLNVCWTQKLQLILVERPGHGAIT